MNDSEKFKQRQTLKRRLDDVIYFAESVEKFTGYMNEANESMMECLKDVPEDVVVSYMQDLASTTFNRANADSKYQLLKSAYVSIHPESIVGEM